MNGSVALDILLVVLLVVFLVYGFRSGFLRSAGAIVGFVVGAIAAFFLVPLVGAWVPDAAWRAPATLLTALALVFAGVSLGAGVGVSIRRRLRRGPLGGVDRIFGAVLNLAAAALSVSILAFSVGSLGIPFLSPAIAASGVIRTIENLTPNAVGAFIAEARGAVTGDALPRIIDAFSGPAPELPAIAAQTPELAAAAQSVVRITGTAYTCGQNQSGSGFVAAPDRVVTNAHVVAGVVEPIVETPAGQALPGRIVYFDPVHDLAVIRVDGLNAPALGASGDLPVGANAVTQGYPFGGPFDAGAAVVISVGTQLVADIYGGPSSARQAYTLASDVQQGESGGPLLSEAGLVAGVIFARSADTANVGYAIAMGDVQPVLDIAAARVEPVSSGQCIRS